ncbi:hypothetical protein G3I60_07105 [Streptomyces sp. SID13666]|uniref:hypothetical protein n=1 Tax=unclassified Streptomyces TaxID=2593676 RepID=UPI0013BF4200|nr:MULTISPECIES: hypothetical protein [unclassified Streptomyces]MCZ4097459.1 hypothetical protein [Streptomyces sp. H39-C1]NEA53930.1 hypothetical protein [Streptomyces sp. SID13666]
MKRALKGSRRGFQFNQNNTLPNGVDLKLLWTRGDTQTTAKGRMQSITADPTARRARVTR